ncbi:class I SAM-dependent methyltransferase [Povalibacter sp.]|uniref:class I SAM-dependent methyltransferase n=1 Tax=Povalibacter sp. TaxID=1962978 RepID=UPI002F400AB0
MSAPNQAPCRVCGGDSSFTFRLRVLDHDVAYFDCPRCGYFQTEAPHWLKQAYASAINDVDTGIMWRNQLNVQRVLMTLSALGKLRGRMIDHAGGYGILVRLLRDAGVDARWRDKYCKNLLARGFEATDTDTATDLLTAFEVFEHIEHPLDELKVLMAQAPAVLVSTDLVPSIGPRPDWWYLGPEHGQHIGFFRVETLAWMARALNCHYATDGHSLHLFSRAPVPRLWLPLQRMRRLAKLFTRGHLQPRIQTDFEALRRNRQPRLPQA